MSYVKVTNGKAEIYTIGQLRRDHPNVSFPRNIPNKLLATYNVYPLNSLPKPEYNELTQVVTIGDIIKKNNKWVREWIVTDLPVNIQKENIEKTRAKEYTENTDPLFFKAQRESDEALRETLLDQWKDAVDKVKSMYPYPSDSDSYLH